MEWNGKLVQSLVNELYKVQSSKSQILCELKSCNSFWKYPPLWISVFVAMHDDTENTSILGNRLSVITIVKLCVSAIENLSDLIIHM